MSEIPPSVWRSLPYRKPQQGRDYWVVENLLPDAAAVAERAYAREDWILGWPHRQESWPGMRVLGGLGLEELALVEAKVREATGAKKLWIESTAEGATLNHNCIQVVGHGESGPRPHTDSRKLCRFAAVLYLNPKAPKSGGTTFFRLRAPNGALFGNSCPPPHANLPEALGVRSLPLEAWAADVSVDNVFNRLLIYRADLVHSASTYFGRELRSRRMTAVFFWMAS